MLGNQLISLAVEFLRAMGCSITCKPLGKNPSFIHQWEKDNKLKDFDYTILIDEYLDLVIQFGFVTLFAVTFPFVFRLPLFFSRVVPILFARLAPLFALIKNLIGLRLDAWKFLSKYKRPIPRKAANIGIWSDIISAISHFAVLTNVRITIQLCSRTSRSFPLGYYHRLDLGIHSEDDLSRYSVDGR